MKRIHSILLASIVGISACLLLNKCTEIGPVITLIDVDPIQDTTYIDTNLPAAQHRKVLLEEFTGVTCSNCPGGHQEAADILHAYPDSVIAVAIHNDHPLAEPFPNGIDFRTQEGIQISHELGGSSAMPVGAIDRKVFSGQSDEAVIKNFWKAYVTQELAVPVPVNVVLGASYDDASREVIISTKLHFLEDVDTTCHLTIYFIESEIIALQLLQDLTVDSNYVHNHVLRGTVTPAFGIDIAAATVQGRVVKKDFAFTLPQEWNADHCEVVAFVHYVGVSNRVLQANMVPVK